MRRQRVATVEALEPLRTPAMERALALSEENWIAERLAQGSVTQLMAISGIQSAHVLALQNAGIVTLLQLNQNHRWPLMGATTDWVREWLDRYVADLALEYAQLRRGALKLV